MANQEHLDILEQGVEIWNKWRQEYPDILPDLSNAYLRKANICSAFLYSADLSRADLTGADLSRATLSRADLTGAKLIEANLDVVNLSVATLSGADLSRANLSGATLSRADLTGAKLIEANLSKTKLTEANLSKANLIGANFKSANLNGADLRDAWVGRSTFGDIDLSAIKGLETVKHIGASEISISTVYRSQGNIPEAFLKGAGVDDTFITYIRSLVGKAIEYYSCFISYSSKDENFAKRLYADLQSNNVRCWFAPEELKTGDFFLGSH